MAQIIDSVEDLTKYIEISSSDKFQYYEPSVRMAERRYLKPVLGVEQYSALIDAISSDEDIDEDLQALLDLCQEAVANIAMAMAVSRLAATIGQNGTTRVEDSTNKSAYQYQEINMREAFIMAGYGAIDDLLALMESAPETYAAWAGSAAYKDYKRYFIQSGLQFDSLFPIRQARYTYMAIRPIMRRVEDFNIKEATGLKLFKALKAGVLTGAIEVKYKALLDDYILPATALLTMARAVYEKAVDITDYGVTTNLNMATNNAQQKQPATQQQADKLYQQLMADGNKYLSNLAEELAKNPSDYPDYEIPVTGATNFNIINKQDNSFLAV